MTGIEWTNETWNPMIGCSKVSAGCKNCYAERDALRVLKGMSGAIHKRGHLGATERQEETRDAYAKALHVVPGGGPLPRWSGKVEEMASRLSQPLRWDKPRMIFVNSMSDLFHEDVTDEYIAAVFAVMASSPSHTFQVLTKRPERMARWFDWVAERCAAAMGRFENDPMTLRGRAARACTVLSEPPPPTPECRVIFDAAASIPTLADMPECHWRPWPLPNVWIGVSVEDQGTANARIPALLDVPAAVRWISLEPQLGPVDLCKLEIERGTMCALSGTAVLETSDRPVKVGSMSKLDWVVIGGESGPNSRPFDLWWARRTVNACANAGVPCFVKQLGACAIDERNGIAGAKLNVPDDVAPISRRLKHPKGADPAEWPAELRVRQWPAGVA